MIPTLRQLQELDELKADAEDEAYRDVAWADMMRHRDKSKDVWHVQWDKHSINWKPK